MCNARHHSPSLLRYSGVIAVIAVGGCDALDFPAAKQQLPAPLAYVVKNQEMFIYQADDDTALRDVVAGTVVDDLATVSGCWGAYFPPGADPDNPLPLSFALMLDVDTGKITHWVGTHALGLFSFVLRADGTFSIVDDNRIAGSTTDTYATGGLPFDEMPEMPFDWRVTVAGDRLLVEDYDAPQRQSSAQTDPPYVRFDCPEESDGE